jgi:hypothetical protein
MKVNWESHSYNFKSQERTVICPTGPGKVIIRIKFLWTELKRVNGSKVGKLYRTFSSGIPQTEDPLFSLQYGILCNTVILLLRIRFF